ACHETYATYFKPSFNPRCLGRRAISCRVCQHGINQHDILAHGGRLSRAYAANAKATANLCCPATLPGTAGDGARKRSLLRLQRPERRPRVYRSRGRVPALSTISYSAADRPELLHGSANATGGSVAMVRSMGTARFLVVNETPNDCE